MPTASYPLPMTAVAARGSGERVDRLQPFRSVIILTRWATLALSFVDLVGTGNPTDTLDVVCFAVLVANGLFRTVRPLHDRGTAGDLAQLITGITFHAVIVALTGYLASPFVYTLVVHVVMAGLARGLFVAMAVAVGAPVTVAAAEVALTDEPIADVEWVWVAWLMLVAVTSTYARRISGEANRRQLAAMDRLSRLADANALLFALHRVAQTLPVLARPQRDRRVDRHPAPRPVRPRARRPPALRRNRSGMGAGPRRMARPPTPSTSRARSPRAGCRLRWPAPSPAGFSCRCRT